ncbi:hypothetical protein [Methanoregula sp.]|uniref:hypothetical protein n=1 Tax=Methanoregula sp. TaxID=2052170 RepID=UPI003C748CC8
MTNWKAVSRFFFVLAFIGFLYAAFISFISMVAMYAPPDVMAQQNAERGQSTLLLFTGIAILVLAGFVSYFMDENKKEEEPTEKGPL